MLDEQTNNLDAENLTENNNVDANIETDKGESIEENVSHDEQEKNDIAEPEAKVSETIENSNDKDAIELEEVERVKDDVSHDEQAKNDIAEPEAEASETLENSNDKDAIELKEVETVKDDVSHDEQAKSDIAEPQAMASETVESSNDKEANELKEIETVKDEVSKEEKNVEVSEKEEITKDTSGVPEKEEHVKKEVEIIDYSKLDLEQLTKELQKLLKNEPVSKIKGSIDKIKLSFNVQFGTLLNEKKKAFIEEGGNEIDFYYSNPIKSTYNDLLFEYKTKREAYYKQIEQEQKENLTKRLTLIDDLKHLIDNAEPSTMYSNFKELQDSWRAIGRIPSAKYNDTWRTYEHHVERFYDLLHLSNDLRDLDFKHNLEEKIKLAEKAEELAEITDLNRAFKELQVLHRLWKEEVGPVAREFREDIWKRFSNATKKIHEKRHELHKELESKYEDNVVKKREVIEKIANIIVENANQSHRYWQEKIKELEKLRQEFFKIGKVPRQVNDKIWKEFKEATGKFNSVKNVYYKNVKKDQHNNLQKKNALVEKAESLKDSDEFEGTTEIMKQIQAEWKTIGHVPRKYSDTIWKKFKDACNHYFDRLHGEQDEANKEQVEVFNKKKELLDNLKNQADDDTPLTLELINSYVDDWNKLGRLPRNMHHIDVKFNKTVNVLYGKLDLSEKDITMLKFKNMVNSYMETNNVRKLDSEQLFIRKKVDELTREIQQLENNISFISNAKDDNPLLKGVHDNIDNYKSQLDVWKTKLSYLSGLDY